MPSSTSNSNPLEAVRTTPDHNWVKLVLVVCMLSAGVVAGWELFWRSKGYAPSLNDDKDLWALNRQKLIGHPKLTAVIGSSRILYGLDLYEWEKTFKTLPVQLATVATNPNVYLDYLANKTDFAGTLLVGIEPNIFFAPEGAPIDIPTGNIRHYETFSYAQKWSHSISVPLEKNLAFLETEDLSLKNLVKAIPLKNRPTAKVPPTLPPFLLHVDENRQGAMIKRVETDLEFQTRVKNIWVNYFIPPAPPAGVSQEQFMAMFAQHMNQVLKTAAANVQKIKDRGGRIIMIRYPSSGRIEKLETTLFPNAMFWDRIIGEVKPDLAISYQDHPELQGFVCPEDSHLRLEDGLRFTQGLIKIIGKELPGYQAEGVQ